MPFSFDTKINSNVTTNNADSRNLSTTSSSADTSTTDNSNRSNRRIQNIGTGDNSSRTLNTNEIRSDRNEVKHDFRYSDSSINYNMASNSVLNIHSPQGVPLKIVTQPQLASTPMAVKQLLAIPESTNTGILGNVKAFLFGKKPVVDEPVDQSLDKPQIIESNMSEDMKDEVVGVLCLAHLKSENTTDRGIFIREKLNSKYSQEWHCIIGTELDGCCMGKDGHYMQLKYKSQTYVIFKTPSTQLHVDLENKATVLSKINGDLKNFRDNLTAEKNDLQKAKSILENEKSNLVNENTELVRQSDKTCYYLLRGKEEKEADCQISVAERTNQTQSNSNSANLNSLEVGSTGASYNSGKKHGHSSNKSVSSGRSSQTQHGGNGTKSSSKIWVQASNGAVPARAFAGGKNKVGAVYVARLTHGSDIIPGKLIPAYGYCYVGHNGMEVKNRNYEVFCTDKVAWIKFDSTMSFPQTAVFGGKTSNGNILYVGRVVDKTNIFLGKVSTRDKKCYVVIANKEHCHTDYELLVHDENPRPRANSNTRKQQNINSNGSSVSVSRLMMQID